MEISFMVDIIWCLAYARVTRMKLHFWPSEMFISREQMMQHEILDFNLDRVPTTCDGMSNMKHHLRHRSSIVCWIKIEKKYNISNIYISSLTDDAVDVGFVWWNFLHRHFVLLIMFHILRRNQKIFLNVCKCTCNPTTLNHAIVIWTVS